ncbi:MAG: hypothetical protein ACOC44_15935 [Promethearchaeia archaeon]
MKTKYKKAISFLFIFLFTVNIGMGLVIPISPISAQEDEPRLEYEGILRCDHEDIVTNDQWQWFEITVDLGEEAHVTLEYSGDLDLDLFAYWYRDNKDDYPEFNGFDLTHCPRTDEDGNETYVVADYSQFRTNDTDALGQPEAIYLENPTYRLEEDQKAYILVYVHSGVGESEYKLNSNIEFTLIDHDDVYDCTYTSNILILYIVIALVIFSLSVYIVRRKKKKILKPPEKKDQKKEKEEKDIIDLNSKI